MKVTIANLIYDVVYKYMMADNKVAMLLIFSILGEYIIKLYLRQIWVILFITSLTLCGCNHSSFGMDDESNDIRINRFDSVFYQWIDTDDQGSLHSLISDYPQLLGLLGNTLFSANDVDSSTFFDNLKKYYSQPPLKSLYNDALTFYTANSPVIKQIEKECANGFKRLHEIFPSMQIPAVYMHISGLRQSMIVADSLLSISIDKYMGADYPLYENSFYHYERKSMTPERVAIDGLYAWLTSEFPFKGKETDLLDKMIYEGKIIYLLMQIGNNYSFQQIVPQTAEEYKWRLKNESKLWKTIINRKHLHEANAVTVSKYFSPAPTTFISEDAPGYLGNFLGYRIVERYMKQTKSSCEVLIHNNNAPEILQKSKYKP